MTSLHFFFTVLLSHLWYIVRELIVSRKSFRKKKKPLTSNLGFEWSFYVACVVFEAIWNYQRSPALSLSLPFFVRPLASLFESVLFRHQASPGNERTAINQLTEHLQTFGQTVSAVSLRNESHHLRLYRFGPSVLLPFLNVKTTVSVKNGKPANSRYTMSVVLHAQNSNCLSPHPYQERQCLFYLI